MRRLQRAWIAGLLLPLTLAAAGCGGGSFVPAFGSITLTEINLDAVPGPAGCAPLTPGVPDPFPTVPTEFVISGVNFASVPGNRATVRLFASSSAVAFVPGPTPFAAGTAGAIDVVGTVFNDGAICGTTPAALVCGPDPVFVFVEVILLSGVRDDSLAGPLFSFALTPPTIAALSQACAGSLTPVTLTITGVGFGNDGDVVTVRFASDENLPLGDSIFNGGSTTSTDVLGTVGGGGTTIDVTTPRTVNQVIVDPVSFYSVSDDLEDTQITIFLANGSCSQPSPASLFQFARPEGDDTVTADVPGLPVIPTTDARQQFPTRITINGTDDAGCVDAFEPVGGTVVVTLSAPGGPAFAPASAFQLTTGLDPKTRVGTADHQIVVGTITSPTTIEFTTPEIDAIVAPFNFQPVITVQFQDGTIMPVLATFNWNARPLVTGIRNLDAGTGTGFLTGLLATDFHGSVQTTMSVDGDNFDTVTPAEVQVFSVDAGLDGAGQPIRRLGTGTPAPTGIFGNDLGPVFGVTPTQIAGETRADGLTADADDLDLTPGDGLWRFGVRVIHGDGQFRDFCPPTALYLTGFVDGAGATLPDVSLVAATGANANTNNNVSVAIDPTSIADDFATVVGTEVAGANGMNIAVACEDDPTNAAFFEGTDFSVFRSVDAGTTWTVAAGIGASVDASADPTPIRSFPQLAYDRFGNLWLTYLLDEPNLNQAQIVLAISVDQGASFVPLNTFSLPGAVIAPVGTLDRPCLAVGPADGASGDQAIYVSYVDLATPQVIAAGLFVSVDGFNSPGSLVPVNPQPEVVSAALGQFPEHARCAVGTDGELYVTWVDRSLLTGSNLFVNRDQDGLYQGAFSWDAADTFVDFIQSPSVARPSSVDAGPPTPMPSIACALVGTHAGRVVIAYESLVPNLAPGVNPDHTRVVTAFSDDQGFGWDFPNAVHAADTADQFLPALCADTATGRFHLSWASTHLDDPANQVTNRFSAASADGAAWGVVRRLSDTGSFADTGALAPFEITDYGLYAGMAAHGGFVVAGWAGNEQEAPNAVRMDPFVRLFQQSTKP